MNPTLWDEINAMLERHAETMRQVEEAQARLLERLSSTSPGMLVAAGLSKADADVWDDVIDDEDVK